MSSNANISQIPIGISEDDLIILGKLTCFENTVWKFPDTSRCPLRSCDSWYSTREKVIKHYRDEHANHSVLCKICNCPIMVLSGMHHLESHYQRKHPNEQPPPRVKTVRHHCSICNSSFKNYLYLKVHMRNIHSSSKKRHTKAKATKTSSRKKIKMVSSTLACSGDQLTSDSLMEPPAEVSTEADIQPAIISKDCSDKDENDQKHTVKRSTRFVHRSRSCTICGRNLNSYAMACSHYRHAHGRTISMCPFCQCYFVKSQALMKHMVVTHSYSVTKSQRINQILSGKVQANGSSTSNDENVGSESDGQFNGFVSNSSDDIDDTSAANEPLNDANTSTSEDIVTIGELTEYSPTLWRFPQTKRCPKNKCKMEFETRSETIEHFRTKHAKNEAQCRECNALITMSCTHNLINHYRHKHADCELPLRLIKSKVAKKVRFQELPLLHTLESDESQSPEITQRMTKKIVHVSHRKKKWRNKYRGSYRPFKSDCNIQNHSVDAHDGPVVPIVQKNGSEYKTLTHDRIEIPNLELMILSEDSDIENIENQIHETNNTQPGCSAGNKKPDNLEAKQNTRSSRGGNKVCTTCCISLDNYVIACDHYRRNHGRNVLMCPYCGQYFLHSNALTKHVLATHTKESEYSETQNGEVPEIPSCSLEGNMTTAIDLQPYDEPLDLTVKPANNAVIGYIDLSESPLHLTTKM